MTKEEKEILMDVVRNSFKVQRNFLMRWGKWSEAMDTIDEEALALSKLIEIDKLAPTKTTLT